MLCYRHDGLEMEERKMMKLVAGEMFEVVPYSKLQVSVLYGNVWDCYGRPSIAKETVWLQWRDWFNAHSEHPVTI